MLQTLGDVGQGFEFAEDIAYLARKAHSESLELNRVLLNVYAHGLNYVAFLWYRTGWICSYTARLFHGHQGNRGYPNASWITLEDMGEWIH